MITGTDLSGFKTMKSKIVSLGLVTLLLSMMIIQVTAGENPKQLQIDAPSEVLEGNQFRVRVGLPHGGIDEPEVPGVVTIKFNDGSYRTDTNGTIILTAPLVTNDTDYLIRAIKEGYLNDSVTITVKDTSVPPAIEPIIISFPISVNEGNDFLVTVHTYYDGIPYATVNFNGLDFLTDEQGRITLTAPLVDYDKDFTIIASKAGYLTDSKTITVLDIPPQDGGDTPTIQDGRIHGIVTSISSVALEGARICALLSGTETCALTDTQGEYDLSVPPGTYIVKISKDGYVTSYVYDIVVQENTASEVNILLEKINEQPSIGYFGPEDFAVEWGIQNNVIGAEIITTTEMTKSNIYNDQLSLLISPSVTDNFTFTISGPNGIQGTVVALSIRNTKELFDKNVSELRQIHVIFDGVPVAMAPTFGAIFNTSDQQNAPLWAAVITGNDATILIRVPHFSEHQIKIYTEQYTLGEAVEAIGGITVVILYVVVIVVLAVVTIIPAVRLWKKIE